MAQSVTDSGMTDQEVNLTLELLAIQSGNPEAFLASINFVRDIVQHNPALMAHWGYVPVKYYNALKYSLAEQKKVTDEATEALTYNLGI